MLTDKILEINFDLFIWGFDVDIDPSSVLRNMTTDEIMSWNDSFYSNPVYDEMFKEQQYTLDLDKRQEIIFEMQRMIYEEAPYVILSYSPERQAYRTDRFDGWVQNPAGGPVVFTNTIETYEQLKLID